MFENIFSTCVWREPLSTKIRNSMPISLYENRSIFCVHAADTSIKFSIRKWQNVHLIWCFSNKSAAVLIELFWRSD